MLTKFIRFFSLLVLVAPFASALTLAVADGVTSGGTITISWTTVAGDPVTWSFELINPTTGFGPLAVANNVNPSLGTITIEAPVTASPGSGYEVEAVDISNIAIIYATSPAFDIGATLSTTASLTTAPATGITTNTATTTANSLPVTSTSGISAGTGAGTGTGTGTGTSTASTTPSSAATSSRLSLTNTGAYAVLWLSAVAGAAVIAL